MPFKQVQRFIYAEKIFLGWVHLQGSGDIDAERSQYKLVRQSQIVQRAIDSSGKIGYSLLLKVFFTRPQRPVNLAKVEVHGQRTTNDTGFAPWRARPHRVRPH